MKKTKYESAKLLPNSKIEIPLTKGFSTTIDAEDFDRVTAHGWCADTKSKTPGYVRAFANIKKKIVKLHRFLLGVTDPLVIIDHIDGNPLNNSKANLRIVTRSQNQMNRVRRGGKIGVCFDKRGRRWMAYIGSAKDREYLGRFSTQEEAQAAYDAAALIHFNEYRRKV